MRTLLSFLSCTLLLSAYGQRVVDVTDGENRVGPSSFFVVSGTPFVNEKYVKLVDGTPYFNNEWMSGVLVGDKGQEYKCTAIKLNLFDKEILYKDEKGNELIAETPLKEVILTDAEGNNFRFIHSSYMPASTTPLKEGWYLWLASGQAALYKFYNKQMSESKPYNSATTEQRITTKENYLVYYYNAYLEIRKIKDAPSVLANKKTELENFLNNKDDKKAGLDDRFTALINYYNSLFADVQ